VCYPNARRIATCVCNDAKGKQTQIFEMICARIILWPVGGEGRGWRWHCYIALIWYFTFYGSAAHIYVCIHYIAVGLIFSDTAGRKKK
jgi:hypothetical protein